MMDGIKIAVLPFVNHSDPNWDYLALGLREVALNWFKKNPFFQLITVDLPSSAFEAGDISLYLERLHVSVLIRGDLWVGTDIRLAMHSHAPSYPPYNWEKELQTELKQFMELGNVLNQHLQLVFPSENQQAPAKSSLPQNPEAFRNYLLAQHYFQRWDRAYMELALTQFEKVADREPDFIPAYVGIAKATIFLVSRGYKNADQHYPGVIRLLEQMLLIDPTYGELYIYKGIVAFFYLLDWESAYQNIERGLQNFTEASEAYSQLSLFWYGMRAYEKALEAIHIAMEYNPLSVSLLNMKGDILISAQRYKEAQAVFQEILALQPQDKVALENLMYIAGLSHNKSKALHYLGLLRKDPSVSGINFPRIGYILAKFGFEKQCQILLEELMEPSSTHENHAGRLANIYTGQGAYAKAMQALEKYFNSRMGIIYALTDPQFLPLRTWPQYQALERQIKLPQITDMSDWLLIQTDLKQSIRINPQQLLYAKADSNYTEIIRYNNFRIEKIIARISLQNLLKQLPPEQFFQCHRSYLLNTRLEYRKSGNSRGYVLESVKYGFRVPVSRSKIQALFSRIPE